MTDIRTSPPLPYRTHGPVVRVLTALATPGGAVYLLAIALLIATIAANPNFGDPGVLIRFLGRTAPIAIVALGQYYVIVSGESSPATSSARTRAASCPGCC
jgi:ribose transport system permease protein